MIVQKSFFYARLPRGIKKEVIYSKKGKILKKKKEIVPSDVHDGNEGIGLVAGDTVFANYLFENGVMGKSKSYFLDFLFASKEYCGTF